MPGYRPERVAEMIHRELAERLRSEVKDPRVEPVSITGVTVTRDLSRAEVAFMPLGGGKPSEDLVDGLSAASRQLRGPIGRALRLRHAPELVFVYDEHTDAAFRVTSLLGKLEAERRAREGGDAPVDEHIDPDDAGADADADEDFDEDDAFDDEDDAFDDEEDDEDEDEDDQDDEDEEFEE